MAGRTKRQDQQRDAAPDPWQAFREKLAAATLTPMQRRFLEAFIERPVGAAAARAAGYSRKRDRQQAYDNLRKPKLQRLIEEAWGLPVSVGFPPDCVTKT